MSALDDILEEHKGKIQAQIDAERAEFVTASEAEKNWERTTFIRDSVTLLYMYGRRTPTGHTAMSREEAWEAARGLWDAKPEDC